MILHSSKSWCKITKCIRQIHQTYTTRHIRKQSYQTTTNNLSNRKNVTQSRSNSYTQHHAVKQQHPVKQRQQSSIPWSDHDDTKLSLNIFREPWPKIDPSFWKQLKNAGDLMEHATENSMQKFDKLIDSVSYDPRLALIVHRRRVTMAQLASVKLSPIRTYRLIQQWFDTARAYTEYKSSDCAKYIASHHVVLQPNEDCVILLLEFAHHQMQRLNRTLTTIMDCWIASDQLELTDKLRARMHKLVSKNSPQTVPELIAWFALCANMKQPGSPVSLGDDFHVSISQLVNDGFYVEAASALSRAASMNPPFFINDPSLVDRLSNALITDSLTDRFKLGPTSLFCGLYDHMLTNMSRLRLLLQIGCVPAVRGARLGVEAAIEGLSALDFAEFTPEEDILLQRIVHQFAVELVKQKCTHLAPSFISMIQSRERTVSVHAIASLVEAAVSIGRSADALLLFHYCIHQSGSSDTDMCRLLTLSIPSFVDLANEDAIHDWLKKASEVNLQPTPAVVRSLIRSLIRLSSAECGMLLLDVFAFASSSHSSSTITSMLFDDFLHAASVIQDAHTTQCLLQFKQQFGLPCSDHSIINALAPFATQEGDNFVNLITLLPLDFLLDVEAVAKLTQPVEDLAGFCTNYEQMVIAANVDPLIQLQLRCTLIVVLTLRRDMSVALRELKYAVETAREGGLVHEMVAARLHAVLITCHRQMRVDEEGVFALIRFHAVMRDLGFPVSVNDRLRLLHDAANIAQSAEATRAVIGMSKLTTSTEWADAVELVTSSALLAPLIESSTSPSSKTSS